MKYTSLLALLIVSTSYVVSTSDKNMAVPLPPAKNIILLIGDGMGLSQVSSAIYNQSGVHSLEKFPVVGFQKTQSKDNLVTDSAASGTAIASGIKTNNNYVGMDKLLQPVRTILEEAEERGLATGLIATSSIVHATPAAFIAHQKSRNLYEQIAEDFLRTEIDLFIGGGKQYFDRRNIDGRDLVKELKEKNYLVQDYFTDDIFRAKPDPQKNFAFFTADNQPVAAHQGRDYLPIATNIALGFLPKRSEKGFFIMIEGSQIDWSCHANQGYPLLEELADFEKAIQKALEFAKKDGETLILVTADHETGGFAINPGSKKQKLEMAFTTNGHTGSMVPVFAYGPQADLFGGIYENTEIFSKMQEAFGWER